MKENFVSGSKIKGLFVLCGIIVAIFLLMGISEDCDKSKIYVNQYPVTGAYAVWTDGGMKAQWWGNVHEYSKTSQVEFTGVEVNENGYVASGENPAAAVTFNDRGRGYLVGSLRVVLPVDFNHMSKIQQDFGSEEALITTLIKPTLYKVVTSCGPLMSSLESVSETRTDLIQYITDQLNNGVYKTRTIKTEAVNELTGEKEIVTRSEIITDKNGNYRRQEISPFQQYGVTCNLVSITDIKYDSATQKQIDAQKQANLAAVSAKTKSLEAIQQTVLVTERGKQAAETAKWQQEEIKAKEVTKAQQEFEVAELAAKTAQQVALKVKAEGEAEAAIAAAKVKAGLSPREAAEIHKEMMIGIAHELANSTVQWVPTVMVNGNQTGGNMAMESLGLNMFMDNLSKWSNWGKKKK